MSITLCPSEIRHAVEDLDALSREEYGIALRSLLADPDRNRGSERMKRITGIVLKRKFAAPHAIPPGATFTQANRAWEWNSAQFEDASLQKTDEFVILDGIRDSLPALTGYRQASWDQLVTEADTERGLYKLLTLWLNDKWNKRETKAIKDYLARDESAELKAALDIADFVSQQAIVLALLPIVPHAEVVVALSLIAAAYGHEKITQAPDKPDKL